MPRPRKQTDLDQKISQVLASIAPQIAAVLREHVSAVLRNAVSDGPPSTVAAVTHRAAGGKKQKRNFPAHCIFPGCTNAHKGPGSGFFCEEHKKLSKAEKQKIKAAHSGGTAKSAPVKHANGAAKANKAAAAPKAKKAKRNLSAAGRKRLSDNMKARWAQKKAAKKG